PLRHPLSTHFPYTTLFRSHAPQAHQRKEGLLLKPALGSLRLKRFHQVMHFILVLFRLQWNKQVWLAHVAIVFRDFVFENKVHYLDRKSTRLNSSHGSISYA